MAAHAGLQINEKESCALGSIRESSRLAKFAYSGYRFSLIEEWHRRWPQADSVRRSPKAHATPPLLFSLSPDIWFGDIVVSKYFGSLALRLPDTDGGKSHEKGRSYFLDKFPQQFAEAPRTTK
jgi:hypothetical protein